MTTLIFLLTVLSLLVLIIRCIVKITRRKPVKPILVAVALIVCGYSVLWLTFFFISSFTPVPPGTDVCFDDWCATIARVEKKPTGGADSSRIILHVTVSNHARGIAQNHLNPEFILLTQMGITGAIQLRASKILRNCRVNNLALNHDCL